jgi:hypothetical protein
MTDFKEEYIEIAYGFSKSKTFHAVSSQQISCNLIERACVEELERPWTRSDQEINYDFSHYASPPLGQCTLTWGRIGGTSWEDTFIVVEEVKQIPYSIILGPAAGRLPLGPAWNVGNNVYTYVLMRQTAGNLTFPSSFRKLADRRFTEKQQEQKEKVRLAALRNPEEMAQEEARIRRRWAKKKEEQNRIQRAKVS